MTPYRLLPAFVFLATVIAGAESFAQRTPSGELDLLRNDEVRQELGLSELQVEKLTEIQKGATPGTEFFAPYLERMKGKPPEEAAKIREELNAAVAVERVKFQERAADVLTDPQRKALRAAYISRAGIRALGDSRVAQDLGLSDEQKTQITTLLEERRVASRNSGSTDEERDKFEQDWATKILAGLTPEQKTQWENQSKPSTNLASAPGTIAPGAGGTGTSGTVVGDVPPEGAQVVSSFGADVEMSDGRTVVDKFRFNFAYAPWEQVLKDFAAAAGYTLDLNVTPPGTLSHQDDNVYSARETLDIMNGYLLRKGFALVLKDGFLVCLDARKGGIPPTLVPDVTLEELEKVGDHEIVRIEVPVSNVDVGVMAQEVETLLGPIGKMSAFTQTGTLFITDAGDNLRRITRFIRNAMEKDRPDDALFKVYSLRNLPAEEAEFMLLAQFGMRQGAVNVSASNDDRSRSRSSSTPAPTLALQVYSDTRTNSLMVTGTAKQQKLVEEIIKAIDVPENPEMAQFRSSGPYLRVYSVTGVDAREITKSLDAMMPGVVVNEDGRAGRIHIWATAKQHEQIEEWIRQFDGGGGSGSVAVIPLLKMDPLSAAATLRSLFLSDGADAPTIETDLYTRVLIIRGSAEQVTQIKTVLAQLGEDGTGQRNAGDGGPIRRYSLMGRDPKEFLDFLQNQWKSSEPNTIRVVIPRQSGPIRELKTPSGPLPGSEPPANNAAPDGDATTMQSRSPRSGWVATGLQQTDAGQVQNNASAGEIQPETTNPYVGEDIRILVNGDELILMSNDEAALDRVESMMDILQQTLPYRTTWTVFYLQASDATETAAMLEQLFPNTSVSSTSSSSGFSFGAMFQPVTDAVSNMTGLSGLSNSPQALRIIPDIRSNSLFVTGPEMVIQEMEQVLRVLDSNEIPESLRDMQPRSIIVQYADIDEVAKIVNDVFKTYTEAPAGRQQQNNPFAALMGGGGGRGNEAAAQVRMTIGVDRQTSTLIVSSSESIFNQVKQVVDGLDESAYAANRSIRIVPLKNADPAVVQQSLSSLFPRVSASTTSSTSGGSSSSSGSPGNGERPPGSSNQQDAFQQMMQERMRQQFGGGTSGRPSGGSTGGRPSFGGSSGRGGFPSFGGRGGR